MSSVKALRQEQTPYVSRTLLVLNLLVFGYGIYLASSNNATLQAFLTGMGNKDDGVTRQVLGVLQASGSISAENWLRGESWRTLTACFVHGGLVHLFMNMYMLFAAGKYVEQMWGHVRFLVIYLIAGVVGTCVGVAHLTSVGLFEHVNPPVKIALPLVCASTALCGILAAEAIWVWLNGKYSPCPWRIAGATNSLIKRC